MSRCVIPDYDIARLGLTALPATSQVGVITYLAPFLSALHPAARLEFVDVCWELQGENDQNWRFRKLLAQYERVV